MNFYGLKNCDTCRIAMKELDAAGIAYAYIDVRADGVPAGTLSGWIDQMGADKLVNRRSTTWRNLTEAEKASAEDNAKLLSLLQANPTLIKRPVIEQGAGIYVGWQEYVQSRNF
ncbi:Spx/MgsR family RNA polymerase-binding regulatory protein [Parvularcula sp. IMCC14364]|uniref:Spx/MgsR family RNA polymerase-binding regulatory protein n=1 Tax=Parvularcula sp. IMCC14364 TaxID=3067902 RepID=UPI002740ABEE|nr:Spx/MgsR family RNA polymerase-binding regulatory protein [Parvularcula sp. IMCC14364]